MAISGGALNLQQKEIEGGGDGGGSGGSRRCRCLARGIRLVAIILAVTLMLWAGQGGGEHNLLTLAVNGWDDVIFKGKMRQSSFAFCGQYRSMPRPVAQRRPPLPFPAHAFWHIANCGGDRELTWHLIVAEQVERIKASGLLDSMNVTAIFVSEKESDAMPHFDDPRISIEYGGNELSYEYPTLSRVEKYCKEEPSGRVIYFHSKGSSKPLVRRTYCKSYAWRQMMEHFAFDVHYETLTKYLSDSSPYNTAGALLWRYKTYRPHFSGNFWVAKCSYINKLASVDTLDHVDRMNAEWWVGSGDDFMATAKDCWDYRPEVDCPEEGGLNRTGETLKCALLPHTYMQLTSCDRPGRPF